jgi:hypothetical protein
VVVRPVPRSILFLAYLSMSLSAVASFFVPLASFALVGWKVWIYVWAGSLTVGGLMGVTSTLRRSVAFELVAITLLLTGYLAYTVVVLYRLFEVPFSQASGTMYVLFSTVALCSWIVRRYIVLWQIVGTQSPVDGHE